MLKKAAILKMADLLKVDKAKIEAALANDKEEVDIEIPEDVTILTKTELETRDRNTYDKAKKAGEEMTIKEMKKKHSLEFTGEDPDKLVEAVQKKTKAELDKNPDERVAEITKTLETTKKALMKANETADQFKGEMETYKADSDLLSMLPKNRIETMTNAEYLLLTKSAIKIENKDGKKVALRNGEVVVDPKTADPIPAEKVVESFFTERKWIKEEGSGGPAGGGRGGGNSQHISGKGKYAKVSELKAELEAENININGEAYTKRVQAAMKENPEMDMNS